MTEREIYRETLKKWDDDFNAPLAEFIADMQDLLASVPEEHRESATIQFDCRGSDYDYSCGELEVFWARPETDAEMAARIGRRRANEEDAKRRELAQLALLKRKYEGGA